MTIAPPRSIVVITLTTARFIRPSLLPLLRTAEVYRTEAWGGTPT